MEGGLKISTDNCWSVLSQQKCSYLLCHHDQLQKVCVAPDRTQLECEKHKRLVIEFKKRRSEGKSGLIIKNGAIIVRSGTVPQRSQLIN